MEAMRGIPVGQVSDIKIPTVGFVIRAHERLIEEFGGIPGIRNQGAVEAQLTRADNLIAYKDDPSIYEIATRIGHGLATAHAFVDGNKLIAFTVMAMTLRLNDQTLDVTEEAAYQIMMRLAKGELNADELTDWIEDQFQPE